MKYIFLDRDGVINKYPGDKKYVVSLRGFRLLKNALEGIRILHQAGYRLCVISNQAGVAKGITTKKALETITHFMLAAIKKSGGKIHRVLYCTHLSDAKCSCRKPNDGLLRKATRGVKVDLKDSYFIGDSMIDVKAGKKFGLKTVLVFSGREKSGYVSQWDTPPDFVAKDLLSAAKKIISRKYERA
jgi:D-glycero-D-manno-heptose 1,7-bisphosphate phosphatase